MISGMGQYQLTIQEERNLSKHIKRKDFCCKYSNGFGDYLYVFGCHKNWTFVKKLILPLIIIAVLVFIVDLFVQFVNPLAILFSALEIVPGIILVLLIVRPIIAYTYGVILGFIGYPIYLFIYSNIEKKDF